MTIELTVLVLGTLLGVVAVAVIVTPPDPHRSSTTRPASAELLTRGAIAAITALVVLATCGWVLPSLIAGVACWFAVGSWRRRDRHRVDEVTRTDAIASWVENLRDVLVAGDQPVGAINATVATCPPAIRPQVRRLAAGLGHQDPALVFRRFADDLDDPIGDLVAAGLLIAVQRGARTAAVLGSLADQARRQADRRRLVEAERAPARREVALLTVIMGALVVGLLVFGRAEYLAAYDTAEGQLFLGVVLVVYALLLLRVQRLARYPRPGRFLTATGATSGSVDERAAVR